MKSFYPGLETLSDKINSVRKDNEYHIIILDACRYDYMKKYWNEFFNGNLEKLYSNSLDTYEYTINCWTGLDKPVECTYVSGSIVVKRKLDNAEYDEYALDGMVRVWEFGWDTSLGICPPEPVTDATLEINDNKIVTHYVQPHAPYIGEEKELGFTGDTKHAKPDAGKPGDKPVWDRVRSGEMTDARLRTAYEHNLLRVIYETARLIKFSHLDNIYITADHGEVLGEDNKYAHSIEHRLVREVPWIKVDSLTDKAENIAERRCNAWNTENHTTDDTGDIQDKLRALGYI